MSTDWLEVAVILAGLLSVAASVLARVGRYRYWLRWYDDARFPFFIRGAGLAGIPTGCGLVLLGIAVVMIDSGKGWTLWAMVCAASFSGLNLAAVLIAWHQPPWSKPHWLIERDRVQPPPPYDQADDRAWLHLLVSLFAGGTLWFGLTAAVAAM